MLINKENLSALFIALKTAFQGAFDSAPTVWDKIATKVPSSTGSNLYTWFGLFPKMNRWVGSKNIKNLEVFKYQVDNEDFEATIGVRRNDIKDDQTGQYAMVAQSQGLSAKQWPDELVIEAVNASFTGVCFDKTPFIGTHKVGKVNYVNKGAKKLNASSSAAAEASLGAGFVAMSKIKDEDGRPLAIRPRILLVPAALEVTANKLANNEFLGVGDANPYRGKIEVVVDGRLTSDTAWWLLDTSLPIKPFLFQEREAPTFVQQTDPNSDAVFDKAEFRFGIEARGASGYGFWQMAYGSDGSAA